jgi:ferric-dicitrate binding protein FerR (iron transport regulator)
LENEKLIAKKLCGELTAEEARLFDDWLNASELNKTAWRRSEAAWKLSAKADYSFEPDVENALRKVKSALPPPSGNPAPFFTPVRVAASILLLACAGYFIFLSTGEKTPEKPVSIYNAIMPTPFKIKMLTVSASDSAVSFFLSDSTCIILNKRSTLSYPENFSGDARRVTLDGEAYFEVKHNDKMPFIISAGNTETKVLGTSFNIKENKRKGNVEVFVMTGKVQFTLRKDQKEISQVLLLPGDHATCSESSSIIERGKNKDKNFWWMRNLKSIRKLFRTINGSVAKK